VWGEGALFAASGLDGETDTASGFVATYARAPYGLLFHTPLRRILELELPGPTTPRIATGDVFAVETPRGELVVTYPAWHTLAGVLPAGSRLHLRPEHGPETSRQGHLSISEDPAHGDGLALAAAEGRLDLSVQLIRSRRVKASFTL
jgi:hypothetical protein